MEYGVVVNNKFALFDNEDEDPLEVLERTLEVTKKPAGKNAKDAKENSNAKVSAKNAKNTAKDTKPAAKPVTQQPAKVLTPAQEQKPKPAQNQPVRRDNATEKPPRFRQNENAAQRERRPPKEENRDQPRADTDFRPERTEQRGEREEFHGRGGGFRRGRGQGRGGRGERGEEGGFDRFGKREFERHSGSDRTGLKPVEKREGGGAHNWGTIADAVAEQEQLAAKEALEQATETDVPVTSEEPVAEEAAEPEERQMTLDEWKAVQDRNRVKASFNIRKAGEGVSAAPEWKKMFVLKKKVDEHEEDEEEEDDEEDDARGKHKTQVPIQIKFNDSGPRGGFSRRGGRGGRGGGPGGRRPEGDEPRRGRSDRVVEAVPNVDNELDFPSLA